MKLCSFCERPIDENAPQWEQVLVWVKKPKRDHAMMREATGEVAHEACVTQASRGISPDQGELF